MQLRIGRGARDEGRADPARGLAGVNHFSAPLTIYEFIDQRQLARPFTISHSWRWTPEYLRRVIPDHPVEVMASRDGNPRYEMESDSHKRPMPFHSYLDWIAEHPRSNDLYMVANNHFLERWGQALIPDLTT